MGEGGPLHNASHFRRNPCFVTGLPKVDMALLIFQWTANPLSANCPVMSNEGNTSHASPRATAGRKGVYFSKLILFPNRA